MDGIIQIVIFMEASSEKGNTQKNYDPKFVNASGGDFRLKSDSKLIDAGESTFNLRYILIMMEIIDFKEINRYWSI